MEGLDNNVKKIKQDEELLFERRKFEDDAFITDRPLSLYEKYFDVRFSEMKGKKILDIGSGRGTFAKEALDLGVEVISINPKLKTGREDGVFGYVEGNNISAARAQEMPFADNSFDSEFALYSVPMYLPNNVEEYEQSIDEVIRTLKKDGKAYFFPVNKTTYDSIVKEIIQNRIQKLIYDYNIYRSTLILTKK